MVFKKSSNNHYNINQLIRDYFILCFLEEIAENSDYDDVSDQNINLEREEL